jgi:hypothetical protein
VNEKEKLTDYIQTLIYGRGGGVGGGRRVFWIMMRKNV